MRGTRVPARRLTSTEFQRVREFDGVTATDSAGNAYTFKAVGNAQVEVPNGGTLRGAGAGNMTIVGSGPDAGVSVHFNADISVDGGGNLSLTFNKLDINCH
ncbi:MAG: hypothetical protein WCD38_01800 [Candidatus Tumulicola sp.]